MTAGRSCIDSSTPSTTGPPLVPNIRARPDGIHAAPCAAPLLGSLRLCKSAILPIWHAAHPCAAPLLGSLRLCKSAILPIWHAAHPCAAPLLGSLRLCKSAILPIWHAAHPCAAPLLGSLRLCKSAILPIWHRPPRRPSATRAASSLCASPPRPSHPIPRRVRPELHTPPPHRPQPCSSAAREPHAPPPPIWMQRLKRVFHIDIEHCGVCGGTLRVIACIETPLKCRSRSELARSSRGSSLISPPARPAPSTTPAHRRSVWAPRNPAPPITDHLLTAPTGAPRPRCASSTPCGPPPA